MFQEMDTLKDSEVPELTEMSRRYLEQNLDGEYLAWVVEGNVGSGGIMLRTNLPRPDSHGEALDTAIQPIILGIYTEREHRNQGIASRMVETILTHCRKAGYSSVVLHASEAGRPLYERLGFQGTSEMRLWL